MLKTSDIKLFRWMTLSISQTYQYIKLSSTHKHTGPVHNIWDAGVGMQ